MDLGLTDKVALVTGGASGIGEAITRLLAAEGAHVVIADRDQSRGEALVDELITAGRKTHFTCVDLCNFDDCRTSVEECVHTFGRLDIVVNNAGTNDAVGLERGPEAFEASLRLNLTHFYTIVHHAASHLRETRGAIVNVSSKVSVTGQGGTSGYAAAKGAINALTREWAVDFASDGVRVNTVVPAEVWTPMYEQWLATQPDGDKEKDRITDRIPLDNRFTTAQEMASAAVFLASPAAGHITGQILHVDGGYVHLDRRISS